jgi:hypothetical protein
MHFDRQPFSRAAFPEQQLLFDAFSGATIYFWLIFTARSLSPTFESKNQMVRYIAKIK